MSGSYWMTGAPKTRAHVERPTARQVLVQLGIVLAVLVVWGGVMAGVLSAVRAPGPAPAAVEVKPTSAAAAATTATTRAPTTAPATAAPAVATTAPTVAPAKPTNTPAAASPAAAVSYAKDIQPILDRSCLKCHGGERTSGGFVVKTYADVMKGSENGAMITPGKSADSTLIDLINKGQMPRGGPKLLPAEIRAFTQWVDAGAPNN